MNKILLKRFATWFSEFKKDHKKYWGGEHCEEIFIHSNETFKILLKKTERNIDLKIDKEISSKKQDRATLMKAKRLSKGKDIESKYIDLRFEEEWENASVEILEPFISDAKNTIILAQQKHEKEREEEHESWRNDPRFKDL